MKRPFGQRMVIATTQWRDWTHLASKIQASSLRSLARNEQWSTVLDLGSGKGYIATDFALNGSTVVCVDIDPLVLTHVRDRAVRLGLATHIISIQADAERLPFRRATVDAVVCNSVIEHVDDPQRLIQEAARVLKERGAFLLTTPNAERRFAHHLSFVWSRLMTVRPKFKTRILSPELAACSSIPQARRILDRRFLHKNLYTELSLASMLRPHFTVLKTRRYMQLFGAIAHDVAYGIAGMKRPVILRLFYLLAQIDRVLPRRWHGKGFAMLCALERN